MNPKKKISVNDLKGISETLLPTVYFRAKESRMADGILKDPEAEKLIEQIDYDFSRRDHWITQLGVACRTEIFDNAVRKFLKKHPRGTVVNLGAGLDTRFTRLDNGRVTWYELDLPEVINIRKKFFAESERYRFIPKSAVDFSWIKEIKEKNNILFVAEGFLMYLDRKDVKKILLKIADNFPGMHILLETIGPMTIKFNYKKAVAENIAPFKWGVPTVKELERWKKFEVIEEWSILDFHKDRWKFLSQFEDLLKDWFFTKIGLVKIIPE
ncbi:MAG: class I SAM-dependent methyltransferase [Chloroflexi bacterium]|nr:class I SAM-dependent methyltransferase [Chloroflexota bacterium]